MGLEARDTAGPPPAGRPGADPGAHGHFLDAVEEFDPELFGMDPADAAALDPQERLLLEGARRVLEDAGYAGARLDALTAEDGTPRSVGVFTAVPSRDYALLTGTAPTTDPADRLSRVLDLRGPSQNITTGDASFLTALHTALTALTTGECAAALIATAELHLHPRPSSAPAAPAGPTAPEAADTLDPTAPGPPPAGAPPAHPAVPPGPAAATGTTPHDRPTSAPPETPAPGEGVAVVLLRPLKAARGAGDRVEAVVSGSAVGHPGQGDTGTVATALARRALGVARVPADGIALREDARTVAPCAGAAGAATGAAAFVRAVLQLRHATLLPVPGGPPVPAVWAGEGPRRALVGVHPAGAPHAVAVLEEPPPRAPRRPAPEPPAGPRLVLLSAPTPRHLTATARRISTWLDSPEGAVHSLDAVARELRTARAARDHRLAVVVSGVPELASALAAFADGTPPPPLRTAHSRGTDPLLLRAVPETRAYLGALWRAGRLEQLARLWLAGVDVLVPDPADGTTGTAAAPPIGVPTTVRMPRPLWHTPTAEGTDR